MLADATNEWSAFYPKDIFPSAHQEFPGVEKMNEDAACIK
jgi:hypothetical protein